MLLKFSGKVLSPAPANPLDMGETCIKLKNGYPNKSFSKSSSINLKCLLMVTSGPFTRFSTCVWQNACANIVRGAMVCEVYFPFSKI